MQIEALKITSKGCVKRAKRVFAFNDSTLLGLQAHCFIRLFFGVKVSAISAGA
jgi:hypothetical protein